VLSYDSTTVTVSEQNCCTGCAGGDRVHTYARSVFDGYIYNPNPNAPPTITQQPSSQSVCPAGTATFTVAASGSGTLSYQWQKNSSNVTNGGHYLGCTTATLTISSASSNDAASYQCVVTGGCGNATSNSVLLMLGQPCDYDHDGDVDLSDFAHFQVCLTGPQVAQTDPNCQDAKMDANNNVDADDLTVFLRCMKGPYIPPDPNCAN